MTIFHISRVGQAFSLREAFRPRHGPQKAGCGLKGHST
jgi:hypothetical protein